MSDNITFYDISTAFRKFNNKLSNNFRTGLKTIQRKVDELTEAAEAAKDGCDEPLDDDIRGLTMERDRVRILNGLRRARPDVLELLASAGKNIGAINPENRRRLKKRWEEQYNSVTSKI